MEIIQELENLDKNLTDLKLNFNNQMNAIEDDLKEFHKHVISLSAKYPEQKEILEFIVFINDKIESNQTDMKSVIIESLNEVINIKKEIIKQQLKASKICLEKPSLESPSWKSIFSKMSSSKDIKWVLTIIVVLVTILGFIFVPHSMVQAFTEISKLGL